MLETILGILFWLVIAIIAGLVLFAIFIIFCATFYSPGGGGN